ncbi:hypothetical protein GT347_19735 [Xylophilus rhododendri]|uniref:DUF1521 domain-containing protein n=1 Tax=Xylophilus rhododendri TaxID=2697032 RepID=A0A857J819_9BURK|nr:hypothetical protein [Xylophilus rhododendri]QHJ00017.1 hypothetical protein GT347_19735 [Xylophilus rhododendri]
MFAPNYSSFAARPDYAGNYESVRRRAQGCHSERHRNFFNQNQAEIQRRCSSRDPYGWRMDGNTRYENHVPAQTQIAEQTDTSAVILAGNNKLTFNKADQSMLVQNADGTQQSYSFKEWGDPHNVVNGQDIGTSHENLGIQLQDGTRIRMLMGNGAGGAAVAGKADYLDTVAIQSPDGTGAVVSGISGPGKLGVTPLDSSYASEFMADQALSKFGNYAPAWVGIRNGQLIDTSNGQIVHDQYGLNRLDEQTRNNQAANNLYQQGYVPMNLASQYDSPFGQYTPQMAAASQAQMAQLMHRLQRLQARTGEGFAQVQMLLAQHHLPQSLGWGWPSISG